ncbi:sodium-coupled monocarboxylate transporter 2 [Rhipicephalus microplus]|uniref:sodium-coupled monocarboxylate transporter 2 n=1 Tax=Rhipicephalus microplus TaxID=6941 RepID=UPI003F6D0AFE
MPSTETTRPTVRFHDYAIFFCLTALSMGIGLYLSLRKRGRASTRDEAFLGSRTLHAIPLALSMVASSVTAVGMIGFVAYYYQYGFHTLWCIPTFVPGGLLVSYLILPVLYELKVTSIFEYLRMRYGNGVGIASSLLYFVLSQTIGAAGLYSAAVALHTIFGIPLAACTVLIGVAGTIYTALGGLRSVVWADCVQAIIMTASPFTIIGKILYDSALGTTPPRPLGDWNYSANILRTELDFTTDETVWAASIGAFPVQLMRLGLDQMITQRFLAARSLTQARTVALGGVSLLSFCYVLHALTGLAMVYWYRDCDPVLSSSIPRYDQIVPYYINRSASSIDGFRGLFLAGIVSASISTVSSVVNSHAAVLYVDIVSPYIRISEKKSGVVMAALATSSGTVMVLLGLLISYIGSAARFFIALNSAAAGPFAGIVMLAFFFPWANAKGTAVAALVVFVLQIWQTTGRFISRITPARMTYGVDRCFGNYTLHEEAPPQSTEHVDALLLYHLSPYWCCFLTMCITVLLGLSFSLLCASTSDDICVAARLASPPVFKLWRRVGLLRHVVKTESHEARETVGKNSFLEIQPLKVKEDNLARQPGKDGDIDIGV